MVGVNFMATPFSFYWLYFLYSKYYVFNIINDIVSFCCWFKKIVFYQKNLVERIYGGVIVYYLYLFFLVTRNARSAEIQEVDYRCSRLDNEMFQS